MATFEQLAMSMPVAPDVSRGLGAAQASIGGALEEMYRRQRMEEALRSAPIQSLLRQATAPAQPRLPGFFGLDTAGFTGAYPQIADTVGIGRPGGAAQGLGASAIAASPAAPAAPAALTAEEVAAALGGKPEDFGEDLAEQVRVANEIRAGGGDIRQLSPQLRHLVEQQRQNAAAPAPVQMLGQMATGQAPHSPAAPASGLEALGAGIETPEQLAIFERLLPSLTARNRSSEQLAAQLANAEQRFAGNTLNNITRAMGIAQTEIASLRRFDDELQRLRQKSAQTVDDAKLRMQLLGIKARMAGNTAMTLQRMLEGGFAGALPGSPEHLALQQYLRDAELEKNAALSEMENVESMLNPGGARFVTPSNAARGPVNPQLRPPGRPAPKKSAPAPEIPSNVTDEHLRQAGFSEEEIRKMRGASKSKPPSKATASASSAEVPSNVSDEHLRRAGFSEAEIRQIRGR